MPVNPNQRSWKNFLIRRDVQVPIVAANLLFLGIASAVLILVLLSPLYHDLLRADEPWVQQISGRLFLILLQRLALAMLAILVLAAVHQIVFSHRFCGPLVNFGRTFDRMARGDFSRRVRLRKGDFLKAEAAQVNAVIDRLAADGKRLNENLERMAETVSLLAGQDLPPDAAAAMGGLHRSLAACRGIVSGWHIAEPSE